MSCCPKAWLIHCLHYGFTHNKVYCSGECYQKKAALAVDIAVGFLLKIGQLTS